MQIVIDIDEDAYKEIKKIVADENEMCFMQKLIANGTPLPKGHGRLIDADALYEQYVYADYNFDMTMEYAPTIIEAEGEIIVAKMYFDEEGLLEEPCLSCDKCYVEDIWYEYCCDEKECPYEPPESEVEK